MVYTEVEIKAPPSHVRALVSTTRLPGPAKTPQIESINTYRQMTGTRL